MAANLTAGGIAIIGFSETNLTDPVDSSFVLLTGVEAGTEIFFTDWPAPIGGSSLSVSGAHYLMSVL